MWNIMEEKNQHGHCSYDGQVNTTTSVLSNGGPQNPMQRISQEPPKEIQFSKIAPPAEEPLDLSLDLSLGGLYREIRESPNPNPLSLTATRATAVRNVNPPTAGAQDNIGIPLPWQPPLPPYDTTDICNLGLIAAYLEVQRTRRFETYRRFILRRRARERAEAKKAAAAAAAAASWQAPSPAAVAAAAAEPPHGPPLSPMALLGMVDSDMENHELCRTVEKMNALGESSRKKILEALNQTHTIGSSISQRPWTTHPPNSDAKAYGAKAVYGNSAIMIENISRHEQNKRLRLPNAVQNSNAPQESSNDSGARGVKQLLTVTTTGDGPQGKKVDGLLYKHGKGGHIFIVCRCHGVFLSPTDFVKHANHTDWSNPTKHIAVSSPPPPPFRQG